MAHRGESRIVRLGLRGGLILLVALAAVTRWAPWTGGEKRTEWQDAMHTASTGMVIPCDLNNDGACDARDADVLKDAVGSCNGQPAYNRLADFDMDGCVAASDQDEFVSLLESGRYGPPF